METLNTTDEQSEILAVTRQLTELMIKKDTSRIGEIVDHHFVLTHITGYIQSKNEWFGEIESESMRYYSCSEVTTSVEIRNDHATFEGQNLLDARIWGTRNIWRLQQTMELEKQNGKWLILKSAAKIF